MVNFDIRMVGGGEEGGLCELYQSGVINILSQGIVIKPSNSHSFQPFNIESVDMQPFQLDFEVLLKIEVGGG